MDWKWIESGLKVDCRLVFRIQVGVHYSYTNNYLWPNCSRKEVQSTLCCLQVSFDSTEQCEATTHLLYVTWHQFTLHHHVAMHSIVLPEYKFAIQNTYLHSWVNVHVSRSQRGTTTLTTTQGTTIGASTAQEAVQFELQLHKKKYKLRLHKKQRFELWLRKLELFKE